MTLHACHNRPPFVEDYRVQDGWKLNGVRNITFVDNRNSKDCKFDERATHPKCDGCKWIDWRE